MSRAERQIRKRGLEAFDDCTVKVVKVDQFNRGSSRNMVATLGCPYIEETDLTIKSEEDTYYSSDAYGNVREKAGMLACRNCQYSGKTPAEVAIVRGDFALAEARRLEAQSALTQARAELLEINRRVLSPQDFS